MRILITGGAGFIGSNLCQFHLKKNDTVFVIDNLLTGKRENIQSFLPNPNFHFFENDITVFDFSSLTAFDTIYHLASPASPVQYKKYPIETLLTNSVGTNKVLKFLKSTSKGTLVLASSSEVYGDPLKHPQTEDYWGNVNPVGKRSCYDEGKRFAEALTMAYFNKYHLSVRIARIFNTFGPNMEMNDGRVVSNFIVQSLTGKPITIYGKGSQTRSFCFVSDMIEALYLLATTKKIDGEIFNLGNPQEKTITELAEMIKKLTNSSSGIAFKEIDDDDPQRRKPDITKAKQILGWQPKVTLEEGIEKTVAYFKNQLS